MNKLKAAFEQWLATKPPYVRRLAAEFPPGTSFLIEGRTMWLLGYSRTEQDEDILLVSPVDPAEDYAAALAAQTWIHAEHAR